ncbi:MAG: SDR family oxidoreductase [Bacteroidota bacterium]
MKQAGLITGASAGIGRALAHEHAKRQRDVILVARRAEALQDLAKELEDQYGVQTMVVAKDLTAEGACKSIYDEVVAAGIELDYLFNNAGFGGHGNFHERDIQSDLKMVDLNINAVIELTHLFLQDMVKRGRGKILNVSSTAGFMPGPLQATYFATKAFVNSWSQAINEELQGSGVSVTALCPGAVNTEFAEVANLDKADMFKNAKSAEYTAQKGYEAMEAKRLKVISEPSLNFAIKALFPFVPMRTMLKQVKKMQSM